MLVHPKKLNAEDVVPVKEYTKLELLDKLYKYADRYNVSPRVMIDVINCENKDWDPRLQSRIINKRGVREDSWGLSQIYLPSHPNTTQEQAQDPDYSLEFMASNLAKKNGNIWTCYRLKNNS